MERKMYKNETSWALILLINIQNLLRDRVENVFNWISFFFGMIYVFLKLHYIHFSTSSRVTTYLMLFS